MRRLVDHFGRRKLLLAVALLVLAVALVVLLVSSDGDDGFGLVAAGGHELLTYLATAALIFADAVIPIFPGETTLNAAATLAAQGHLSIGLVILSAAIGAIAGDSALYWIARASSNLVASRIEKLRRNPKVRAGLDYIGSSAPALIIAGRYVPGLRFLVNATMGISKYSYPRFLLWSAIGGTLWATYTSLLAYWIGSALDHYPLASVAISSVVTTAAIGLLFLVKRHVDGNKPEPSV